MKHFMSASVYRSRQNFSIFSLFTELWTYNIHCYSSCVIPKCLIRYYTTSFSASSISCHAFSLSPISFALNPLHLLTTRLIPMGTCQWHFESQYDEVMCNGSMCNGSMFTSRPMQNKLKQVWCMKKIRCMRIYNIVNLTCVKLLPQIRGMHIMAIRSRLEISQEATPDSCWHFSCCTCLTVTCLFSVTTVFL